MFKDLSRPLDVHRWSKYPEVNKFVNSIFDKAFQNSFFSERELKALEDITRNWDIRKFDQGQKKLLERFIVLVGYDVLVEGYDPLSEYFSRNTLDTNAVKQLAFRVIDDLPEFGNDLSMSFHERYQ